MDKVNDIFNIKPDGFKWLIMAINHETIKRGIFSDLKQVGDIVGVHEATIRNKFKINNEQIDINGFSIMKIPYFKSQRGRSEKDVSFYSKKEKKEIVNNVISLLTENENIEPFLSETIEPDLF
jgi:hypothetical protein